MTVNDKMRDFFLNDLGESNGHINDLEQKWLVSKFPSSGNNLTDLWEKFQPGQYIAADGITLKLPFDDNTNDVVGSATATWNGTSAYSTGKFYDQAAQFNNNSKIDVDVTIDDLDGAGDEFALSFNFFRDVMTTSDDFLFSFNDSGSNRFYARVENNSQIRIGFSSVIIDLDADYSPNTWHNLILSFDGTILKVFLDNVEIYSADPTFSKSPNTLSIGASRAGVNYFEGKIEDFTVYNRELTASERANIQKYKNEISSRKEFIERL